MLSINSTPNDKGLSPASILFGRQPRTTLPTIVNQKTNHVHPNERSKIRYNSRSKDLIPIPPNTSVRIQSKGIKMNWKRRGKVLSRRNEPRSYNVLNDKGNIVRRNRHQLLPTREPFNYESDSMSYDESETDNENMAIDQPNVQAEREGYRTRSGRVVRQPDRYGY